MDSLSSGKPLSNKYLDLWCRTYVECLVRADDEQRIAFSAGFAGQRAISTWKERVRILAELHFIEVKPGPKGEISYIFLPNPHQVIRELAKKKPDGFRPDLYNGLVERASQVGAKDFGVQM